MTTLALFMYNSKEQFTALIITSTRNMHVFVPDKVQRVL